MKDVPASSETPADIIQTFLQRTGARSMAGPLSGERGPAGNAPLAVTALPFRLPERRFGPLNGITLHYSCQCAQTGAWIWGHNSFWTHIHARPPEHTYCTAFKV